MHALIVLAHPEPSSLNGGLARTAAEALRAQGHTVDLCDLYREGFDPREGAAHFPAPADPAAFAPLDEQRHAVENGTLPADIADALDRLARADLVLFQFPLWWWSMPAILKGWFDRVFVWGGVYSSRMRYPDRGHFRGKRALVSTTTGAAAATFGPDGRSGNLDLVLWPIHFGLAYVGFSVLPPFAVYSAHGGAGEDAAAHRARLEAERDGLARHLAGLDDLAPLPFNPSTDWDENGRLRPDAPSYSPFIRHVDAAAERPARTGA